MHARIITFVTFFLTSSSHHHSNDVVKTVDHQTNPPSSSLELRCKKNFSSRLGKTKNNSNLCLQTTTRMKAFYDHALFATSFHGRLSTSSTTTRFASHFFFFFITITSFCVLPAIANGPHSLFSDEVSEMEKAIVCSLVTVLLSDLICVATNR